MAYKNKERNKLYAREFRLKMKDDPVYKEKQRIYRKNYHQKNPQCRRSVKLKYEYGLTFEQYQGMIHQQNDQCAICHCSAIHRKSNSWHVDHDHQTGKVRGLLCKSCNTGLGQFKDDIALLEAAIKYLQKHMLE